MTREEQIKGLYALKEYLTKNPIELDGHKSLPITLIDYVIEALEQKSRKGHWIGIGWIGECSCCHERSFPFDDSGYGSIYHNFCPNCGADMRTDRSV